MDSQRPETSPPAIDQALLDEAAAIRASSRLLYDTELSLEESISIAEHERQALLGAPQAIFDRARFIQDEELRAHGIRIGDGEALSIATSQLRQELQEGVND